MSNFSLIQVSKSNNDGSIIEGYWIQDVVASTLEEATERAVKYENQMKNESEVYEMDIFEDYDGYNDYTDEELPSLEDASEDDLRSVGMWSDEDVKTDEDYDHFGYDRHDVDTPMGEDYGGE